VDEKTVNAGITFNSCTVIVHIGSKDEFIQLIHDLVDEGIITPQVAEQLTGGEKQL